MSKYTEGKIYKLTSKHTEKIYVGSTCNSLRERLRKHKNDYDGWKKKTRNYTTSFVLFELGDVEIELIMAFSCNTKKELQLREGEFIKSFGEKCVNKIINGQPHEIWRENNREKLLEYQKKYNKTRDYETNRESINTRRRELYSTKKATKLLTALPSASLPPL